MEGGISTHHRDVVMSVVRAERRINKGCIYAYRSPKL